MTTVTVSSFSAVWLPGSGEQRWFAGSPEAVASADNTYFAQGLRLVAIDRHETQVALLTSIDQMIGVWRPGTGEQRWYYGLPIDSFKATDAEYFNKGLRLVAIDTSNGTFTGVWRPGSGAQHWESGLSIDEFTQKDADLFGKGFRLTAVDIDDGKFGAVWRPGSGPQRWVSDTFANFKSKNVEFGRIRGLRLVAFDHHDGLYFGVWQAGSGAEYWYTGLVIDDFKQKDAQFFAQGLRIVAIDLGTVDVPSASTGGGPSTGMGGTRNLLLHENAPFSGPGEILPGCTTQRACQTSDPAHAKLVTNVQNVSNYQLIVSHGTSSVGMMPQSSTSYFNSEQLGGDWNAELVKVDGPHAPQSVQVNVTYQ